MRATTIGKAARRLGVNVETIRFYERRGLIERPPKPANGGFRDYPAETLKRIRFIRESQALGFSLSEVGELLSLRADPGADCGAVQRRAEAKLVDVREKIARLEGIGAALERLIAACPGEGVVGACSIMEALDGGAPPPEKREEKRRH